MKFRTEINIGKYPFEIDYRSRGFMIGSCFADNMAARLASAKFCVLSNPTGVMYNPMSVVSTLRTLFSRRRFSENDLMQRDGRWFSLDFHGSFSDTQPERALDGMNDAVMRGAEALAASDYVIVTLGTAWVYEKDGRTVANCHKLPAAEFERRLLSTDEIVGALSSAMERELNGKDVVFSVSPIRHLKDGFAGNSLSKALLRVAVEYVVRRYDRAHYFPSFEIMNDDLRDYRFYEADMAHPSVSAVDYIWEKFRGAFLSEQAADELPQVEKIVDASRHRPIDSRSEQYRAFCRKFLSQAQLLSQRCEGLDLESEIAYFGSFC